MLKHNTLVLTLAAVDQIEKRLLTEMHKMERDKKYEPSKMEAKRLHRDPNMEEDYVTDDIVDEEVVGSGLGMTCATYPH